MIDTLHNVEAPEGVDLSLRLAGPIPRAIAYGADVALRTMFYGIAAIPLVLLLRELGLGVLIVGIFLGEVIYPVAFELLGDGQTLGKRMVGIRVVHDDGTRIRWQASLLRNLLVYADALPGAYLIAIGSMLASQRFQRLGDHAAGTLVVHAPPSVKRASNGAAGAQPAAPVFPLAQDERAAVLAFGARSAELSPDRREELARLATPLLHPGAAAAPQLEAVAAHLRGSER
jgi:uncharacterized RDD family membrane protein YckC